MDIIPAIDLIGGKAVRLTRGDYNNVTVFHEDPLAQAAAFCEAGARFLHVVDLEGAKSGRPENAELIRRLSRESGLRIEAGGGIRTLETVAARGRSAADPLVVAGSGASDIFIYPPYDFKVCDCMLTNFHLPQSTLIMMVSALAGRERTLCAYAMAVRAEYKFFSYGDCMLIV